MPSIINVEDLQVGMFIHLEGGWLSHPFALSSFRLASVDQIATVRRLGLTQVRWSPEQSDGSDTAPAATAGAGPAALTTGAVAVALCAASAGAAAPAGASLRAQAAVEDADVAAERALARQTERQYAEASQAWRDAQAALANEPLQAGQQARRLAQAMLQKMDFDGDIGIRLIPDAGDRNAAHALNVTVISTLIGRSLKLEPELMEDMAVGALMHDVGKAQVPERFRHLDPGFSAAELNAYRDHVAKGLVQGRRMALAAGALAVLAQHHEHVDGSGFPQRHGGDRLTMAARIVAIVNRYDNLCNPGAGVAALTPHEAVSMLFTQGRARYDPAVLNAFIRMMGVYPAGSLVQLTDERYAMVVAVNATRPLRPRVLVHGTPTGQASHAARARMLDLERCVDLGIRRSLPASKLPLPVLQALDPRPRVAYFFEPLQQVRSEQQLAA